MIILGDKYHFSQIETNRLKHLFSTIHHISYKVLSSDESILQITNLIALKHSKLIVLNTKATLPDKLLTYLTRLEMKDVKYITIENFMEKYLYKCLIPDQTFNVSYLESIHTYTPFQKIQKRIIDYIGIFFLSVPALIAMAYTKFRIAKESPGPLFFKQKRMGLRECEFTCIKLRSMHLNAEENGAKFASDDDPRTFPWGKTIRYKKIDEVIQLWNVFKGEMHLVGPRPERKIWVQEFEKSIPYYSQRHIIPPGITGLAQIKYQYGAGQLDAKEKLMYDLYYIKNWSLKLELEIIWKTILFVLTKRREDLSNF